MADKANILNLITYFIINIKQLNLNKIIDPLIFPKIFNETYSINYAKIISANI